MKRITFRVLATGLFCAGAGVILTSGASAQTMPGANAKRFSGQMIGRVVYDSNVSRGNQTVATARTLRKDDILYSPSAKIDLTLPVAGQRMFLSGTVGYEFYQYNKVLERERIDVLAGGTGQVGPCGGLATASFGRRQSDLADLLLVVTKNVQDQITFAAQGSCSIARGLSTNLGVQQGQTKNSAPGSGVVNSKVRSVNAGVSYQNATLGAVGIIGSYSKNDYDDSPVGPLLGSTGFRSYSGGLTYGRPIGNRLEGQISALYSDTRSSGPRAEAFKGLTGSGALTYRASSRVQGSISYGRTTSSTIQQGSSYSLAENVQLDGRYALSSRLKAGAGVSWSQRSYRADSSVSPINRITNEEVQAVFGSLSMQVGRAASLSADVRYEDRNTNLTIFDYTAFRVGLTATQSF